MQKVITCPCGFELRGKDDEEVVKKAQEHAKTVHGMDLSRDQPEAFALAELELHRLIMDASQNPFLRSACSMVELSLAVAVSASIEATGFDRSAQIRQHAALVTAVENGDRDAACAAMAAIIDAERELSLRAVSV